jgi:alanine racemase
MTPVMIVNLAAIRYNFKALQALSKTAECAAVVKGDGYGHGMIAAAEVLREVGAKTYFVATAEDAVALRGVVPQGTIAVLGGYMPYLRAEFDRYSLIPVLNSLEQIKLWSETCRAASTRKRAILQVDTGMNRLGLRDGQVESFVRSDSNSDSVDWLAIMTHFSAADDLDFERCELQLRRFKKACGLLPPVKHSLANSTASYFSEDFRADLYRPGKSTFGINPLSGQANPMKEPASVYAPLLQVEQAQRGAPVGYSSTFRSTANSLIATVGIGYVHGYPRLASNKGVMAIGGFRAQVVGRVSMDVTTIDVTHVPLEYLELGSNVEVLGETVTAEELAKKCGTIEHEILIGLGRGCTRIHIERDHWG